MVLLELICRDVERQDPALTEELVYLMTDLDKICPMTQLWVSRAPIVFEKVEFERNITRGVKVLFNVM